MTVHDSRNTLNYYFCFNPVDGLFANLKIKIQSIWVSSLESSFISSEVLHPEVSISPTKVKGWAWESYWITGGFFSWLIVPFIAAALTVPNFMGIIAATDGATIFWTYFLGLLWGIGGLTFGLSMRYLGISLGMAVALGFCSAFGALIPPVYMDLFSVTARKAVSPS